MASDADKEPHAVPSDACKPQQNGNNERDWDPHMEPTKGTIPEWGR